MQVAAAEWWDRMGTLGNQLIPGTFNPDRALLTIYPHVQLCSRAGQRLCAREPRHSAAETGPELLLRPVPLHSCHFPLDGL